MVCDRIREIKEKKMDLSKFILSRTYSKDKAEYKNPPAYIAVVEDMTNRGVQFSKGPLQHQQRKRVKNCILNAGLNLKIVLF